MARHDQRLVPRGTVCFNCRADNCVDCIDVPRIAAGLYDKHGPLCECKRKKHDGEPAEEQILDPETGTVYAPGLRVTLDGEVVKEV